MKKRALLYSTIMLAAALLAACFPGGAAVETASGSAPSAAQSSEPLTAPPATATAAVTEPADTAFVRVADEIPDVLVDLKYATDNNFTGRTIYNFKDAYLRYGTVKKLAAAADDLRGQGYRLILWDAFRPVSAQWKLWSACPNAAYVADPNKGYSSHSRGNTVDVTLADTDGKPVEMPSDFDDFTALANRDYSDVGKVPAQNAALLETTMKAHGFKPYSAEWWHFSDETAYPVEESFVPGA